MFVLVPANVWNPLAVRLPPTYPDGTAMDLTPTVGPVESVPDAVRAFLGEGGSAFQVTFPADQNPHQQIDVPMDVGTWIPQEGLDPSQPGAVTATLTATVTLRRV